MSWIKPAPKTVRPFSLSNRKYIGSKRELASRIAKAIVARSGVPDSFFDVFAGTGAVTQVMAENGAGTIFACDNLKANTVILSGFFDPGPDGQASFLDELEKLNDLSGCDGYITAHFADTYFSRANCRKMDAVREGIARGEDAGRVPAQVSAALMASFLLAADRAANTLGQYDAYLKHIGSSGFENGRHVADSRIHEPFRLKPLSFLPSRPHRIYTADIFSLLATVKATVAYLDPPYNTRQYCDNYHVLENLARWEKPALYGKTRKFDRTLLKSPFSSRRYAKTAVAELLAEIQAEHVWLSYNSEGILSRTELIDLLSVHGKPEILEFPYPVFGKGAGVSRKRQVTEYLLYVKKAAGKRTNQGDTSIDDSPGGLPAGAALC
ncbi:MAG TPA: hypothetical protein ENN69_05205 [Spirochaetia bacterium]|nr:hypothetical protein [Spirochaetia bacterium]